MTDSWTITRTRIPEQVVPGKRLGRHYLHDSRSAFYEYPGDLKARALADQLWTRSIPILDQGNVGSCTGNAMTGLLGTAPFYSTLPAGTTLDEAFALKLYSQAEVIDGGKGLPTEDEGSTGTSVAKAAQKDELTSGYQHATTVTAMAQALQDGPVVIGVSWYDSFDTPNSSGLITISKNAQVRGGHELELRGVDIARRRFKGDNSWNISWGDKGSFEIDWDTMATLLGQEGDCTVPVPLSKPAPTPTPPAPSSSNQALAAAHTKYASAHAAWEKSFAAWQAATGL